jgi:hypothetical protein
MGGKGRRKQKDQKEMKSKKEGTVVVDESESHHLAYFLRFW